MYRKRVNEIPENIKHSQLITALKRELIAKICIKVIHVGGKKDAEREREKGIPLIEKYENNFYPLFCNN
jgi:hypothetical protein